MPAEATLDELRDVTRLIRIIVAMAQETAHG